MENASELAHKGEAAAAARGLEAFVNAVEAQSDKKITSEQANKLIADAQAIIDLLSG